MTVSSLLLSSPVILLLALGKSACVSLVGQLLFDKDSHTTFFNPSGTQFDKWSCYGMSHYCIRLMDGINKNIERRKFIYLFKKGAQRAVCYS